MKFVIGIQTCERLDFLEKCINSLIKHNPKVKDFPFFVLDDASTSPKVKKYLESLSFINNFVINEKRMGISVSLKRLSELVISHGDVLLCIQADWYCSRKIDFNAIEQFFIKNKEVVHLRTIRNKGEINKPLTRHCGKKNGATQQFTEEYDTFTVGSEVFTNGTWSYADVPNFTTMEAVKELFKCFNKSSLSENCRMINIHNMCNNVCMLETQPFWNLDPTGNRRTPGGKR